MAAQWPLVKAWLVSVIPTLPGMDDVAVYAGSPVTGETGNRYITVGYVEDDAGGAYQQSQAYDGAVWGEVGEIRSQIVAQAGDSDSSIAETSAFAIADALDAAIRSDRTLGALLSQDGTTETAVDVLSISNPNGTATALVHTLRYTTTT